LLALRSIILLNGGAIIGLFTFLGNLASKNGQALIQVNVGVMPLAFSAFVIGLIFALLACLASYMAQGCLNLIEFGRAYAMYQQVTDPAHKPLKPNRLEKWHPWYRYSAIFAGVASVLVFAAGSGVALSAVSRALEIQLPTPPVLQSPHR
jgi:hypothetical protein